MNLVVQYLGFQLLLTKTKTTNNTFLHLYCICNRLIVCVSLTSAGSMLNFIITNSIRIFYYVIIVLLNFSFFFRM